MKKIQRDMRAFDVQENREILRRQKQADQDYSYKTMYMKNAYNS